jgi:hypothetical protein
MMPGIRVHDAGFDVHLAPESAFTLPRNQRSRCSGIRIPDVRAEGFLETRCLQLLSLIECIVSHDAAIHNSAQVLDEEIFKKRLPGLSREISALLSSTFPEAPTSDLDAMCSHLQGFNYLPFRKSLSATAKRLALLCQVRRVCTDRFRLYWRSVFDTLRV